MKKPIKIAVILICAVLVLSAAVGLFYRFFQYRPFKDLKVEDVETAVIHSVGYEYDRRYELSEDECEKIVSLMSQLKIHLYKTEGFAVYGGADTVELKLKDSTEYSMWMYFDAPVEEGKEQGQYIILNGNDFYLLDCSNREIFEELDSFVYSLAGHPSE